MAKYLNTIRKFSNPKSHQVDMDSARAYLRNKLLRKDYGFDVLIKSVELWNEMLDECFPYILDAVLETNSPIMDWVIENCSDLWFYENTPYHNGAFTHRFYFNSVRDATLFRLHWG